MFAPMALAHWHYTDLRNAAGELCCNDKDCSPIPNEAVRVTRNGYEVLFKGEFTPVAEGRVLISPDGRFHACIWGGQVKCFLAPPMGS